MLLFHRRLGVVGRDFLTTEEVGFDGGCRLTYQCTHGLLTGFLMRLFSRPRYWNEEVLYVQQGSSWWRVDGKHLYIPIRDDETLQFLNQDID